MNLSAGETAALVFAGLVIIGIIIIVMTLGIRDYGEGQRCAGAGGTWAEIDRNWVCLDDYTIIDLEDQ